MSLNIPTELEQRIAETITRYPPEQRRAPVIPLLHLLQEHYGCVGAEQVEWIADRLGLRHIDVWELVSFYPMFTTQRRGKFHIKVCRTLSCEIGGCKTIMDHLGRRPGLREGETTPDGRFSLSSVECLAACGSCPVMMVNDELFTHLTTKKVDEIIDRLTAEAAPIYPPLPPVQPQHPLETRLMLSRISKSGYAGSFDEYVREGGYSFWRRALEMKPESLVEEVSKSGLRGCGGAGFLTGNKWKFVNRNAGKPVYLIANADESEPGTFKDRLLIHHDPHLLLEGILIAAYALGAKTAYIFIRGEFPEGARILERAIGEACARNLAGRNILGRGIDCDIYVHRGAGAYIGGEETGLIESLEGKRAYPRIKPPFPAARGLFGCPTVVNNVETLCHLPQIVEKGGDWFHALGVQGSRGTRLICVSGNVARPGCYEIVMGKLTLRQLIDEVCGGMKPGHALTGIIPGGSSMPILTPDKLDTVIDSNAIYKAGSYLGSAGMIVIDDQTNLVEAALNIARFYAHESCGQCTPCREGILWMEKILQRMQSGQDRPEDADLLLDIADNIDGKTICAFGEAAAWPIKALIGKYRKQFEAPTHA